MKTLFILLLVAFTGTASAQTFDDAVEYNDYIVDLQNQIGGLILEFNEKMGAEDVTRESIQPHFDKMLSTTQKAITKVEKLKGFEGNVELRNRALELFKFYYTTFSEDYKELLDIFFSENLDEAAIERMNVLLEKVTTNEAVYDDNYAKAQQAFAKEHNFELIENELQEELDSE